MTSTRPSLRTKVLVALATSATLLLAATIFLALRVVSLSADTVHNTQWILHHPEIRDRVVRELVGQAGGDYDSHPDPDVGRVMRPRSDRTRDGIRVASNQLGLRERSFELPKTAGTVRVVILGDSFVFGTGIPAEDRMGVFLEDFLRERGREEAGSIEVLHYGLISWNVISECAYLRRQMSLLQPDLVIHITVRNDLDDLYGVRGYGAMAKFTPQHRERADALIQFRHPSLMMGIGSRNYLTRNLDDESRKRFERCANEITRLAQVVEAMGGRYLHVLHWNGSLGLARRALVPGLREEQVCYLSADFATDPAFWNAPNDTHWNRAGMERLAKLFYALIQERGLLPALAPAPWTEASAVRAAIHDRGLEESAADSDDRVFFRRHFIDERIDLMRLVDSEGPHFNGGIDTDGLVSPHASLSLRRKGGTRLRLIGRALDRVEMAGARVEVDVEGFPIGSFELIPGANIEESWPLPEAVLTRRLLTVRLRSSDYIYVGDSLQHCVSFRLEQLSIEQ